jgi:hypothetical protein
VNALAVGVVAVSILAACGLAGSTLATAADAGRSCGFGVSPGAVETAELEDVVAIGVRSTPAGPLWTGDCEAVNALAVAVAGMGETAGVPTAAAFESLAGRWTSSGAAAFAVASIATLESLASA